MDPFFATLGEAANIKTVVQGKYEISNDPSVVLSTVLGSCVAVCMFDPIRKIGGMNHFLLPGNDREDSTNIKYGSFAMECLINDLLRQGAKRERLAAKLFGGGRMRDGLSDIGKMNATFGHDFLEREGITCLSESTGGTQARRVQFIPTTGAARQKFVQADNLVETNKATETTNSGVELF